ncbi:ribonuclease HII [Natronomonas salsuginis]|uniref:Ribonuclease n=1 Tax=Natronomonas salsuginis TaxID=2217661 RepID=A0A4U5JPD0_9EURY|nr:ribonuclease HII [Natronomonas salsuginis]TKR28069.1 ribonuclease HII [Natronomonas salsuginis]
MEFGVDEAGKGPVLGSMFAAAIRASRAELPDGIGDSKRLTMQRREDLAARLRENPNVEIGVAEITPEQIDAGNMNELVVSAHAKAADAVVQAGDAGLCDAGDVDADRFGSRVEARISTSVAVDAVHRADESDALVGAASIIAKSEREAHVDSLRDRFGEIGSGYPSDQTTRAFLSRYFGEHGEFPSPTRRSWATCDSIRASAEQTDFGDF